MVDVEVMWTKLRETYIDLFNAHTEQVEAAQAERDHWREMVRALEKEINDLVQTEDEKAGQEGLQCSTSKQLRDLAARIDGREVKVVCVRGSGRGIFFPGGENTLSVEYIEGDGVWEAFSRLT